MPKTYIKTDLTFKVYYTEDEDTVVVQYKDQSIGIPTQSLLEVSDLAEEFGQPMFRDIHCVALWCALRWWNLTSFYKFVFSVDVTDVGYEFRMRPQIMPPNQILARQFWSRACHSHLTSASVCDTL